MEDGFVELGHQVETAVKSAQESEAAKQFSEQVKETMDKARESDVAAKLEEGLVTGLRELNDADLQDGRLAAQSSGARGRGRPTDPEAKPKHELRRDPARVAG